MSEKRYGPTTITPNFYQLGMHSYPAYLSMGDDGMLIEGGTGATFAIIVEQIKELGINPERIKYLALTHTHPDHIGAIPQLKKLWPHLKVVGSAVAKQMLQREEAVGEFLQIDHSITEILIIKNDISEWPAEFENPTFDVDFVVDMVVGEGDKLDLGSGIVWNVYETPGHAPCHISLYEEKEGTLAIGDVTGFYVSEKNAFWPNYFQSLETYCNSIRKLSAIPAKRGALGHNGMVDGQMDKYFAKAMKATEAFHMDILERLDKGENPEKISIDKTKLVYLLTNLQPFASMQNLTKLLIRRSQQAADKENLFVIP
ncbi:MAG TPA: MBL fold metallo-hydrolase [Dehalococcoidia bacterium]|nr:MBL fold metallo-hydrolase [Dehalococcoidia bacterium]